MELKGKTFIVTDGDNELGKELITILLSKECNVIALYCKNPALNQIINNDSLTVLSADITDEKSVESLYKKSLSIYGKIDGIINNAGIIQSLKKISDLHFDTIEHIFNINYFGVLNLSKIFLPHFFSLPEANLVISSSASLVASQRMNYKSSGISSLKMLIEGLKSELLGTNVKVMCISSGIVSVNNLDKFSVMSPCETASTIVNGMEKELTHIDIAKNQKQNFRSNLFSRKMRKIMHKYFKINNEE
jgi:short-subunit dehydrogenase